MTTTVTTEEKPKRSTRRRGNGEGSIYQRRDGRWCATINIGYNAAGKRRRKSIYGVTKREVQEELTRLQSRRLEGRLADPGRQTVGQYLDYWLENASKPNTRATTYGSYERTIRKHIKPRIGGVALAKLSPVHIQQLYSTLATEGMGDSMRQLVYAILHKALDHALKMGLVARNVCDAVERPRLNRPEIRPLGPEQAKALLTAAAGDRLEALYVLALTTGMRLGELFALEWSNVDLQAGYLTVRYTLMELNGKVQLSEPKTPRSRRKIELPKLAVDALWQHKRKALALGRTDGFVFRTVNGFPIRRGWFYQEEYKPLLERAGLPRATRFHDLRHTAATLLLAAGENPKVVQELLGHSNIAMTLGTYSHILPTMQRQAVDKLGAMLSTAAG
jgi:integrase